jgi:hypothetical protein
MPVYYSVDLVPELATSIRATQGNTAGVDQLLQL